MTPPYIHRFVILSEVCLSRRIYPTIGRPEDSSIPLTLHSE